jgi:hypothetical protein
VVLSLLPRKCAAVQDIGESKGANRVQNGAIVSLLFRCEIWSPSFKEGHFPQMSEKQLTCSIPISAVSCSEVFPMLVFVTMGV